jgi:hypothetical protein
MDMNTPVMSDQNLGRLIVATNSGFTSSLDLLRAIDETEKGLLGLDDFVKSFCASISALLETIKARNTQAELDRSGKLAASISGGIVSCDKLIAALREKKGSAEHDLHGDHADTVCSGYDAVIESVETLREMSVELLSELKSHDEEFTVGIGPFDSVEKLFAALDA